MCGWGGDGEDCGGVGGCVEESGVLEERLVESESGGEEGVGYEVW